jgi:hypothetical protein
VGRAVSYMRTGTPVRARSGSNPGCFGVPVLFFLSSLSFLLLVGGAALAADGKAEAKKVAIPFDFVSKFDNGRYGQIVGDLIWKRLERDRGFVIPESMQDVRDLCRTNNLRIGPDTPLEKVRQAVRKDFDGQIGIWGSVERAPGTEAEIYDLTVKCVDFSRDPPQVIYEKTARTNSVSEIPDLYVKEMMEKLTGRTVAGPQTKRLYATDPAAEARWKNGPNLIAGGDFESALGGVPKGWEPRAGQQREPLGNLVKWLPEADNAKNHVIRFTFPAVVGDNEGVMYYSRPFPVQEGAVYRFQCRWRTNGPAVKVFIKCYDEQREVFRSQQNLYGPKNAWNTQTEDFTPSHPRYSPKWGRVMLYAYIGSGVVEFDDVVVKQIVPPRSQNLVKDPRHSSASKVTIKEMEENERRAKEADRGEEKAKKGNHERHETHEKEE